MKFTELGLSERLLQGIQAVGFTDCTEVQERALAYTLKGQDVSVQSQTGTGKTATFLITVFETLLKPEMNGKQALVIAPTRELADQIEQEARLLGQFLDFKVGSFYGGVGYHQQEKILADGVDVLICTPGRLLDLSQQKKIHLNKMGMLVIDEADRLFDMGFLPDLRKILKRLPRYDQRLSMLFSATLNFTARDLGWEYMNNPVEIEIEPEQVTVDKITQELYHVGAEEKMTLLLGLLQREKPKNCLVFANTKQSSVEIAHRLEVNGYPCKFLIGDLPQKSRLKIIAEVKDGKIPFLVATDIAARGLHVDDLELVINYDIPQDSENYVHRIGRTARAGRSGKAITLACEQYVEHLDAVERFIHGKIPVCWADDSLYVPDQSAGLNFRSEIRAARSGGRSGGKFDDRKGDRRERGPKPSRGPRPERAKTAAGEPAAEKPQRERSRKPAFTPQVETKPPTDPEERLAYYAAKYGETFKKRS